MPIATYGHHQVHYELSGEPGRRAITFLNGLTQDADLWQSYAEYFVPRGWRVLAYDLLGQGRSSGPVIDIELATPIVPQADATLRITAADGAVRQVTVLLRIDTPIEVDYYKHGGILPFVLRQLLAD